MTSSTPPATHPQQPPRPPRAARRRATLRRLARTALFGAVRGLGYAAGTSAAASILWWIGNQ
jgi:hypothetical protein